MTSLSEPAFELRDVTYRYGEVTALRGISLTLRAGRRAVLLGANGCGKSTLLRLLDALCFPAEGRLLFCGAPLSEEALQDASFAFGFRRRVGFVFQNPDAQLFSPTVFDEVAFGPLQLRLPRNEIRKRVMLALDLMEITHLRTRSPHHLSTGEKKRTALASVLVLDPEILLLDEPTASLDPKSESQMIDFLVGWRGGAKTVITATHDLGLIEDIADDCFVLQEGQLAAAGLPAEILADTRLLERASLLHAHRHTHASGIMHSHPHLHQHEHP